MKQIIFGIFLLGSGMIASCQKNSWQQTSTGIKYKLFTNDSIKDKPVFGDHIWMHLRKYDHHRKELFNTKVFETENGVSLDYRKPNNLNDVISFFSYLGKGDSMIVKIPTYLVDSLKHKSKYYTYHLNLIDFKSATIYKLEKEQQLQQQHQTDSIVIFDFFKNNQYTNFKLDSNGVWYMRTKFGTGKKIEKGNSISIHYKGYLLSRVEFDNSYLRNKPLNFTIGKNQVIDGLDKGILHFHYGDKGTIIIPSNLAYGDRLVGAIPANSVLLFDVEILEE